MFHRHVEALVSPLGWGNPISWWPRGCLVVAGETDAATPFWVHLMRLVGPDPLELARAPFCLHRWNRLPLGRPHRVQTKHREEVDVGVGQHARPQVGELGLGTIVVRM